jgi:hypothetical protein
MKTIAFHSNQLSVTGTEVALYDYAHYNETLLGNRSVVVYDRQNPNNHPDALTKFSDRFDVIGYDRLDDFDTALKQGKAELMYAIKSGKRDGVVSRAVPTMVHAVFPTAPWQVHGHSYAFISEWLSRECSADEIPTVPHIVTMPDVAGDLRLELGIPAHALVLGCYGGARSFDVPCAIQGVQHLLETREDIYFIFLHLTPFLSHKRAIFLPGTTDMVRKTQFINTCDVMAHARAQGESFGLACGEFSVRNKRVMTYKHCKHAHHHEVLGNKGLYYGTKDEFVFTVNSLDRTALMNGQWDCYTPHYNPERVMGLFDQFLIQPALANTFHYTPKLKARLAYIQHKLTRR